MCDFTVPDGLKDSSFLLNACHSSHVRTSRRLRTVRHISPTSPPTNPRRSTELGVIVLQLRPDVAPVTVAHISKLVSHKLFDATTFYRSDFVIQCGLHGTGKVNPYPALAVNETKLSNTRGTAAIAHWDVPDCGNAEFFINLGDNAHLDSAYGGYCVFAAVAADDAASWVACDAIAKAIAKGGKKSVALTKAELF